MQPRTCQLPVVGDFLTPWSTDLDERNAVEMFLGKTADEAEAMFRQNFVVYQEDLSNMRVPAFRFYVLPAMKYLVSEFADGDSDAASTFCFVLEDRFRRDPEALAPIAEMVVGVIRQILEKFDRFDCSPDIYGDVPARYRNIVARLST